MGKTTKQKETHIKTSHPDVFAIVQPPGSFDPLKASNKMLNKYGFPVRPTVPKLYEAWHRHVTRPSKRIIPDIIETEIRHKHRHINTDNQIFNWPVNSSSWSGAVILDPSNPWRAPSAAITGQWTLPFPTCNLMNPGPYYCSQWVGFDGWNNDDVFQCGTETDIICPGSSDAYFWFERYPDTTQRVGQLSISSGEIAFVTAFVNPGNNYFFKFENITRQTSITLQIFPPPGYSLFGNSCEWIVERPIINQNYTNLTNYGNILISGESWYNNPTGVIYFPGVPTTGTLLEVSMIESGNIISQSAIVGAGSNSKVSCNYVPNGATV
jgi:hypothetical protein